MMAIEATGASGAVPLENVVYVFDGTVEGLLTAVFQTYALHEKPQDISREGLLQPRLDQSVRFVETDAALAERVRAGVCKRAGRRAWEAMFYASLADDPQAPMTVYRFVRYVMTRPAHANRAVMDDLSNPIVGPVAKLSRYVLNERHHMQQFLRFEHFENDIWFAKCNPKANVVPLLMDWFSGRFNTQRFIIYDEVHHVAGIYDGADWILAEADEMHLPEHAAEEKLMQQAWKGFYSAVSISARYHPELRRHFMPKRFWRNIIEVRDGVLASENGRRLDGSLASRRDRLL